MTPRPLVLLYFLWLPALLMAGCSAVNSRTPARTAKVIDPQEVQAATSSFAERYVVSMADVYDRVQSSPENPRARDLAQQNKLLAGQGAMGNAVNPNPIVGLMDMALMVSLTEKVMEDPWARQELGNSNCDTIVLALKSHEADIWNVVGNYLSPSQIVELRALTLRWREEHPNQHYVGGAQLADFPEAKKTDNHALQFTSSIFGLMNLDPFSGLDPAVRQVEESRILAERVFYYLQNMPMLISWQTDVLYARMLAQPQVTQALKDTSALSTNSTDFAQATGRFADASARFAQTIETFRTQLPEQQATLAKQVDEIVAAQRDAALKQANADITTLRDGAVQQVNDLVAAQRDAALKQAGVEISAQRDAAIKQLAATVTAQQDLLTKNLQEVTNGSIDHLYKKLASLVLLASGSLLAVLLVYRVAATYIGRKGKGS